MTRWLPALALVLSTPALAAGPDAALEADFAAATERSLKGDAEGAIALYHSLLDRGAAHPDVQYNLGVALAARERPVEAIVAFERALSLDPADDDARANLGALRAALARADGATAPPVDAPSLADTLEPWIAPVWGPSPGWAAAALEALLVAGLVLARRGRRWGRGLALAAGVALTPVALALAAMAVVASEARGVVVEALPLEGGPDARFEDGPLARRGARVAVLREDAGWLEVRASDGGRGWLPARAVERL